MKIYNPINEYSNGLLLQTFLNGDQLRYFPVSDTTELWDINNEYQYTNTYPLDIDSENYMLIDSNDDFYHDYLNNLYLELAA